MLLSFKSHSLYPREECLLLLVMGPIVHLEAVVVKRERFGAYREALVHHLALFGYLNVSYKYRKDLL
jgi:hypothetical protein